VRYEFRRAKAVARVEGITPGHAMDALVHTGYDAWMASRLSRMHSSPELDAKMNYPRGVTRSLRMASAAGL
jgi:hypothetical protein